MVRQAIAFCMKISAMSLPKAPDSWSTWLALYFTRCSFSLASAASPRKAQVAEAQLPAYCRIDGRNETRSGRRLPRIGNTTNGRTMAASSHGELTSPMPYPSQVGKPPKIQTAAKMKKTFHSRGTASGNVEMMKMWNTTIPAIASQVMVEFVENSRTNGRTSSTTVPPTWAITQDSFEGRRSFGYFLYSARLNRRE